MGYEGHTRRFPHLPDCRRRPHPAQYRAASEPRDILGSGWDPMKVEVRRESGEHNHRSLVCCTCGGGPVVRPPHSDEHLRKGFCRDCLLARIERMRKESLEWCGLPDGVADERRGVPTESSEDDVALWNRFEAANASHSLLHWIKDYVDSGVEQINYGWDGGPADQPPTRMTKDVVMVRSLLERHGYREVSVVTGIARDLAAQGRLGYFYALYQDDDDRPHWTAYVVFQKVAVAPDRKPIHRAKRRSVPDRPTGHVPRGRI